MTHQMLGYRFLYKFHGQNATFQGVANLLFIQTGQIKPEPQHKDTPCILSQTLRSQYSEITYVIYRISAYMYICIDKCVCIFSMYICIDKCVCIFSVYTVNNVYIYTHTCDICNIYIYIYLYTYLTVRRMCTCRCIYIQIMSVQSHMRICNNIS